MAVEWYSMTNDEITERFAKYQKDTTGNDMYFEAIYLFCKREFQKNIDACKIIDSKDREDIFHDIMLYVIEHKELFSAERITEGRKTTFSAWINCIISSHSKDYLRKGTIRNTDGSRSRREILDVDNYQNCVSAKKLIIISERKTKEISNVYQGSCDFQECEEYILKQENEEMLKKAIGRLNVRYATVVKMFYYYNWSEKAIVAAMNTSVGAVEKILYRARTRIKEYLIAQKYISKDVG